MVADALSRLPLKNDNKTDVEESFLNRKVYEDQVPFPLDFFRIRLAQQEDKLIWKNPDYLKVNFGSNELYVKPGDGGNRVVVPKELTKEIIEWYHTNLQHPGSTRMYATIKQHFYWKGMKDHIHKYVEL